VQPHESASIKVNSGQVPQSLGEAGDILAMSCGVEKKSRKERRNTEDQQKTVQTVHIGGATVQCDGEGPCALRHLKSDNNYLARSI
jgi:hypothetical protein